MFEGYYRNEAATRARTPGGRFHTGDLGYRDADGFFYYAGRTADWLRVDSENLASGPIEQVLTRFPAVTGAAVYPVPDPHTGDQVMAALETGDAFDAGELAAFLRDQDDLGTKSMPRLLRLVDALPVTATRKVDKPELRRLAWTGDDVLELVDGAYRPLDDERRRALEEEYAEHRGGAL